MIDTFSFGKSESAIRLVELLNNNDFNIKHKHRICRLLNNCASQLKDCLYIEKMYLFEICLNTIKEDYKNKASKLNKEFYEIDLLERTIEDLFRLNFKRSRKNVYIYKSLSMRQYEYRIKQADKIKELELQLEMKNYEKS